MSCLQNEGNLNNDRLTVTERERNKKIIFKYRTLLFGFKSSKRKVNLMLNFFCKVFSKSTHLKVK
jgi:hypothetical protein